VSAHSIKQDIRYWIFDGGDEMNKSVIDKRAAILKAAMSLFAKNGYEKTSTKSIAAAAGVAEGTIYVYFESKRHILLSFLEEKVLHSLLDKVADLKGKTDEEMISAILLDRIHLWDEHGDLLKVVLSQALYDKELAKGFVERVTSPACEVLTTLIMERIADGRFMDINPSVAVRALAGQFIFVGISRHLGVQMDMSSEEFASEYTKLFLNGIRKERST
jgi:AcrR family transcriptional regulator